jgi:hypothetical protein
MIRLTHMTPSALRTGALMIAMAAAASGQTKSVLELFNSIPKPPATPQEADKWLDADQIASLGLAALNAELKTHVETVMTNATNAEDKLTASITGATTPEESVKRAQQSAATMAKAAGIDMARIQRDPAYAKEVEARMKNLSQQEKMAMANAIMGAGAAGGMARGRPVVMADPPAITEAAEMGATYNLPKQRDARRAAQQKRWAEVEKKIEAVRAQPLTVSVKKPSTPADSIGCEATCGAQWDRYADAMLPKIIARETEILRIKAAAIEEQRAALAADVRTADKHFLASKYGLAAQQPGYAGTIALYDGSIVGEMQVLITRIEETVKPAAFWSYCGQQAVRISYATCPDRFMKR